MRTINPYKIRIILQRDSKSQSHRTSLNGGGK